MVRLKRRIGWIGAPSTALQIAAVAAALALLGIVFIIVYAIASR